MRIFNRLRSFSRPVFITAGLLMLVQVLVIGLRRYGVDRVPEWWAAPPAIGSVVAIIVGLITLYSRTAGLSPGLALASVSTGLASGLILGATAFYLVLTAVEAGAVPHPLPPLIQGAIALFMISFVTALLLGAAACFKTKAMRAVGVLLLVPVLSWCLILGAAMVASMTEAMRLDVYTNGVIAVALIAVGILTREHDVLEAQV